MSIAEKSFWIQTWILNAGNLGRAAMAKQPYNRDKMQNICLFLDTLRWAINKVISVLSSVMFAGNSLIHPRSHIFVALHKYVGIEYSCTKHLK